MEYAPLRRLKDHGKLRRTRRLRFLLPTVANQQANARYQAGLGTIVEVADAQRLLTQAQIDDALARLGVWRALLGVAAADGDIQPFLAEASQ